MIMKGESVWTQDWQHEPNNTARDFIAWTPPPMD